MTTAIAIPGMKTSRKASSKASDLQPANLHELAVQINAEHVAACQHAREAVSRARRAGEMLIVAKDECPHGDWLSWLVANCPDVAERTARAYMQLAHRCLENPDKVAELESLSLRDALRSLAAPKAPRSKSATLVADLPSQPVKPDEHAEADVTGRPGPQASPDPIPDAGSWEPDEEAAHAAMVKEYDATVEKVMGSSEPLTKAHDEIKRLTALVGVLTSSRDGFMNGKGEIVRLLKKEQSTTARLERQIERLKTDNEALRERISIMEEPA